MPNKFHIIFVSYLIKGRNQACKGMHPGFSIPIPIFSYLTLEPTQKKRIENPRKTHPFYKPGRNSLALSGFTKIFNIFFGMKTRCR